ncbi:restriction endonuclease subunit S [Thermomonas sp.]|uniref:restriction endonuclease subunit S n=1 Tax=Thermomonas sp. TaxID=1971895 RepID=UPI00260E459E|nr:restriction endonuclease subunit S [Thermomonas sp.]
MARKGDKATVPKVRFPEFVGAQNWSVTPMGSLYAFMRNNLLSRDKLNYERGVAKNIHYGDIHTKFQALFDITRERVPFINESELVPGADSDDYCVEGDLIFADASEDMRDVGKCIEVVRLAGERLLSGQHTILARRKDDALVIGFGGHLFRSGLIRSGIEKEAQGTKVYQISSSRLGGIDITYPSDKGEQQKIADCLTSLEEVIAAQGRKVDALKAHKRGLMQQLFPREGETRPRLRFPEFRDAPEWEVSELVNVCEVLNNRRVPIAGGERRAGPYPYYGASGVVDYVDNFIFDERLLLVGEDGAKWGAFEATAFIVDGKYWVNNHAHVLRPTIVIDTLLENYLTMIDLAGYVSGHAPPKLTLAKLKSIPILFPASKLEQQRIADCLSSLDTQIAAEANQLAALKIHKQGLMQQLFPTQGPSQ